VGGGREVARLCLEHDACRRRCGGVSVNYHDGRRIGAILVDSDGLAYVVLIDGTLEETPGRCQVALASECEVDRLAVWPPRSTPRYRYFQAPLT